jgi:hypothetical protein
MEETGDEDSNFHRVIAAGDKRYAIHANQMRQGFHG